MKSIPTPSEMMRAKRPYLYSDSENRNAYRLSSSELSHHLTSLTDRNQHKDFEIFARKLCEREICPNFRPQTGPEGGGDGKVDSESYPVDGKISERWFVAEARNGNEKWAFAVSAKKQWAPKVRSDVQGIADTKRGYNKIIFATNRPTRAKDRLRVEDELTEKYGIPVTILDREWILDRVFTNDHKDLAYECLKAGQYDPESVKLGPNDFRNQQALDEIEDTIKKMGAEPPDHTMAVALAYEAASLSRRLERPRYETEGRFLRAIEFAQKYGANFQELRAVYGQAWTRVWWFDDIRGMQELYERVEAIAFETGHAQHINKVHNLFQILVGQVLHGVSSPEELQFFDTANRLQTKLEELAKDANRPNNALYAETLLCFHQLNLTMLKGERQNFDETWKQLSTIIDRAEGLGEYPADMLDSMIDALAEFAPQSAYFDELVERIAEFMAERNKELKAGKTYLRQGERKLEAELPIEAIKYLGRATVLFMKEESREEQHRALYCLAVAYRGADLLWAARGASIAAIGQISALSESESEVRIEIVPTTSLFAMISLQLGNIADFLAAYELLLVFESSLPLDDESKAHLRDRLNEFDRLFSCLITGLEASEVHRLEQLPDILDELRLFCARMALLYRLGHRDILSSDGSLPEGTPIDEVDEMMSLLGGQPASRDLPNHIFLLDNEYSRLETSVLGADISITSPSSLQGYLLAEAHVSYLEAFVSTFLNRSVFAHTEQLRINIDIEDQCQSPLIEFEPEGCTLSVKLPTSWDATEIEKHSAFMKHLTEFGVYVLGNAFMLPDFEKIMDEVVGIERAFDRAAMFSRAGIARNRFFGSYVGQLSDWQDSIRKIYEVKEHAPNISAAELPEEPIPKQAEDFIFQELRGHSEISVSSIINQHLWNSAKWCGMAYGCYPAEPPIVALMFEDADSAKAIFREWRKIFSNVDKNDEVRISIIKGIDGDNPYHYRACVGRDPENLDFEQKKHFVLVSRLNKMTVDNHVNLDMFLKNLDDYGFYLLAPAIVDETGQLKLFGDLSIAKSKFHVREAWQIGVNDLDIMGISLEDNVIIPENEKNAPVIELLNWKRSLDKI